MNRLVSGIVAGFILIAAGDFRRFGVMDDFENVDTVYA